MRKIYLLLVACALGVMHVFAQENCFVAKTTAYGQLAEVLGDKANEIDSLVVEGPVNADDFYTMFHCGLRGNLKVLNLVKAEVEGNKIPDFAFYHIDEMETDDGHTKAVTIRRIILPETVTEIGRFAFCNMNWTEDINLPSYLQKLGEASFYNCIRWQNDGLVIPTGVEKIPMDCFRNCKKLVGEVVLPSKVKEIGAVAFYYTNIEKINFPEGLEKIGESAFYSTKLRSAILPESCLTIDQYAFTYCDSLSELRLPSGLDTITNGCFNSCVSLKSVKIPSGVKGIGNAAFYYNKNLRDVELNEGLERIGEEAFFWCALDSLVLPASLKHIGGDAFYDLDNLTKIYSKATVPPECGYSRNRRYSFTGSEWQQKEMPIYIPVGTTEAYFYANGWNYFLNFVELETMPGTTDIAKTALADGANVKIAERDGGIVITSDDANEAVRYTVCTATGAVVGSGAHRSSTFVPCNHGVYIVKVGAKAAKIVVK